MKEFKYVVTDPEGIHARPAGMLVKAVKEFSCDIKIAKDGKAMNCKAIFGIMGLAVKQGEEVTLTFDGADEVDPDRNLIKGRGGALFKEKLLISSSNRTFILVDESKQVSFLGSRFPVPVEVFPMALPYVEREIRAMGASRTQLRPAKGKDGPVITESGNLILDAWFSNIHSSLEKEIKSVTGVIENGLFMGYDVEVMVAK